MSSQTNLPCSIAQLRLLKLYHTTGEPGAKPDLHWKHLNEFAAAIEAEVRATVPIDMVLHCPNCGTQHIDSEELCEGTSWDNPPHRSHLCHACGHIWRPADVPTNGVKAVLTKGKADSPVSKNIERMRDAMQHGVDIHTRGRIDGSVDAHIAQFLHAAKNAGAK